MSEHDEEVPLTAAEARLAELAREGREMGERARAAEEDEARRIERRERREAERLGRGYVRAAVRDAPRRSMPPLLAIFGGAVVVASILLFTAGEKGSMVGIAIMALAIGGFFGARWVLGIWLAREERAWLLALPFPVRGYFRVLADSPAEERELRVRITFCDAAPSADVLEGMLARVTVPATARITGGAGTRWSVESGPIRTPSIDDMEMTNAMPLYWMRAVIKDALMPLHAVYPLRSVRFSG